MLNFFTFPKALCKVGQSSNWEHVDELYPARAELSTIMIRACNWKSIKITKTKYTELHRAEQEENDLIDIMSKKICK